MLAFMDRIRWLFSLRSLFVLTLACAVLLGTMALIPRHVEMWPGSRLEHHESSLFVDALDDHFGAGLGGASLGWNMPAKGSLRVMVWGITSESKQNEIREWAIAEKNRTGLELKVRIEFYEKNPPENPGPERLLRAVEL